MRDKPIIINDIDVSECENALQGKHTILCAGSEDRALCDANTNCSYKKFKRKEQEYEEMRQYHNKCCTEFENEKQALLEKYNQVSTNFYNGDYCNTEWCSLLKAKEQECEELKKKLKPKLKNAHCTYFDGQTRWCKAKEFIRCNPIGCKLYTIDELSTIVDLQHQLDKLKIENNQFKQTLAEIKEICNSVENIENINSLYDAKLSGMYLQAHKILKKISECEVKNE